MPVNNVDREILDSLTRRYGILRYLATRHSASLTELAEQFGVGTATIHQDIYELMCCSLPTSGNKDDVEEYMSLEEEGSVVVFNEDHEADIELRLTSFEISAILLVLSSLKRKPEMWDAETVASLGEKLEAALGHDSTIVNLTAATSLDHSALLVKEAVDKGKQLEFDYLDLVSGSTTHRVVDPHTFFSRDGHYYLLCWDTTASGTRTFRTDRMRDVTISDTDAAEHPSIEFDERDPFGIHESKKATIKVKEHCTWILDYILMDTLGRTLRQDGTYTAVINYFDEEWLIKWAIENRDRITVESPSTIVQAIEDRVTAGLVRYGVN